jgi:hypothetical protein
LLNIAFRKEDAMNRKPPLADPADAQVKIPPVESPRHDEALIDQAVAETFPASDPISPAVADQLEPGDVRRDAAAAPARTRRNGAWIAFGAVALAILAMRALRGRSSR